MTSMWGGELDDEITRGRHAIVAWIARQHERVSAWIDTWEPAPMDACPPHGTPRPEGWER